MHRSRWAVSVLIVPLLGAVGLGMAHRADWQRHIPKDRPSKISHETRYSVSVESRNLIVAAWNDSGVGKVAATLKRASVSRQHILNPPAFPSVGERNEESLRHPKTFTGVRLDPA